MDISISPFIKKTFDLVSDESTNSSISWNGKQDSFIIHDRTQFQTILLPQTFKHNNLGSFFRELKSYGFTKNCIQLEFSHMHFFSTATPDILSLIKKRDKKSRRRSVNQEEALQELTLVLTRFEEAELLQLLRRDLQEPRVSLF